MDFSDRMCRVDEPAPTTAESTMSSSSYEIASDSVPASFPAIEDSAAAQVAQSTPTALHEYFMTMGDGNASSATSGAPQFSSTVPPAAQPMQQQPSQSQPSAAQENAAEALPPGEYAPNQVELCKAPAEIPVVQQMGLSHWWLRTPDFEAGMGPRGGGVPGAADQDNAYTPWTTINDHHGRGQRAIAECHPASQVGWGDPRWEHEDRACLDAEFAVGRGTGLWVPPFNDCHSVVKDALDLCRTKGDLPSGGVPMAPQDMGETPDGGTQ
jgi:hypothetical protein